MTKSPFNQKGFGIISTIIFLAVIFALVNVYAYYNPSFSLARYSPLNYFRQKLDNQRVKDLNELQQAIQFYYNDKNQVPGTDGWCGRMSTIIRPEVAADLKPYLKDNKLLFDPTHGNSDKDYFYYRVDRAHYILMAVLDFPQKDPKLQYNFTKCHDWPGNDVYNYQINNLITN